MPRPIRSIAIVALGQAVVLFVSGAVQAETIFKDTEVTNYAGAGAEGWAGLPPVWVQDDSLVSGTTPASATIDIGGGHGSASASYEILAGGKALSLDGSGEAAGTTWMDFSGVKWSKGVGEGGFQLIEDFGVSQVQFHVTGSLSASGVGAGYSVGADLYVGAKHWKQYDSGTLTIDEYVTVPTAYYYNASIPAIRAIASAGASPTYPMSASGSASYDITLTIVPEPDTITLLGMALLGFGAIPFLRRRSRA